MDPRDHLVNDLKDAYGEIRAAVGGLSDDQASQVFMDGWSAKDILAHLVGWSSVFPGLLERIARGERPVPDGQDYSDVNAWNARFSQGARGRSLEELLRELDATEPKFEVAISRLSEDRLQTGKTAHRLVKDSTADHMRAHAEQIRAWRQQAAV